MNRTILPLVSLGTSIALSVGCGSGEQQNYRKVAQGGSLDGTKAVVQPVQFSFSLPSRSTLGVDAALLQKAMTGYAWRIEGQGDLCKDTTAHESYGPYDDARTYAMELSGTCNYLMTIMVGELATTSPVAALTATINYDEHIKPVIQQQCVSCHADYDSFAVIQANAASIVSHIENETMPPNAPLDGSTIALFLAWGDDGFAEINPNPQPVTTEDKALKTVLYRNNTNDMLMDYELMGRTTYDLRRSLWIQPDGEALGLTTQQLYTFRATPSTAASSLIAPRAATP